MIIKILFLISKIISRKSTNVYAHEIEKLENEIFEKGEDK